MILAVFDHLWQSTLFTLAVGLLVLTMRNNQANARFGLWLAASLKFLIPFSVLIAAGKQFGTGVSTSPQWTVIISDIASPSSTFSLPSVTDSNTSHSYGLYLAMAVWAIGFVAVVARWAVQWKRVMTAVRSATPVNLGVPIDTRFSATALEPGVVGIRSPILLLPNNIETHLTSAQMRGVLDHELCHVRRRDNLTSALHMVVEALFWFYPLVWWLGARLIVERERACDEAVVRGGNDPHIYAEGILSVCKAYVRAPLVCTSGVSGGDLSRRIENIMANRMAANLGAFKKAWLGFACAGALLGPVVVGLLDARPAQAQTKPIVGQLPSRVKFEDSVIRVSADSVQESGDGVRYTGNVILESIGSDKRPTRVSANKASDLGGDWIADSDLRIDDPRSDNFPARGPGHKPMLLEGVQIEVDGRTFTTGRAIWSGQRFKTDELVSRSTGDIVWEKLHREAGTSGT